MFAAKHCEGEGVGRVGMGGVCHCPYPTSTTGNATFLVTLGCYRRNSMVFKAFLCLGDTPISVLGGTV